MGSTYGNIHVKDLLLSNNRENRQYIIGYFILLSQRVDLA